MRITNTTEIRVIGLQRSGNHPIINWIGSQYPKKKVYLLNNIEPYKNPFKSLHRTIIFHNLHLNKKNELKKPSKKDCLIYSYEDIPLEQISSTLSEKNHDKWLGKSSKRYDVLILRDPFNLFASRLQRELDNVGNKINISTDKGFLIELWKQYAKEYLGLTNYLKNKKIIINYNRWFLDKNYRKHIANALDIPFTDKGFNEVLEVGNGSSFDGLKYHLKTHKMNVLKRWKKFHNNKKYKSLFKDLELIKLSNKIFGCFPGRRIILK